MPAPLGNHNATKTWDDERDAALKACLADGMTFEETASVLNKRFGTACTRSAVAGRTMRLKIKSRNPPKRRDVTAPLSRAQQLDRKAAAARLRRGHAEKVIAMPPATPRFHPAEVDPLNIALVDLEPHHCRWPIGGFPDAAPVTFCGQVKCFEHESYCHAHWQLSIGRGTSSERRAA